MRKHAFVSKVLALLVVLTFVIGQLPLNTVFGQSTTVKAPYIGMWITTQELASLPTSGTAWNSLANAANQSAGTPDIINQDSDNDVYVLAKALVYARTGETRYRTEVIDHLKRAMGTEAGGRTLALGRNLVSYVIAADLINLPADSTVDQSFRTWLRRTLTETLDGKTLVNTHEDRPNNWGTHAGASRAAVAVYLKDQTELARTATVFRGWVGDRAAYSGFSYGDLAWQCNSSQPVGINPKACVKSGQVIDGALPEEMRRAGGFQWPPAYTGYAWEGMQGAIVQAMILHRAGYPAFEWQDKAILRAYQFLYKIGWKPEGDDMWQVWLVNSAYGTTYAAASPAGKGKNMGWTDWTHANRTTTGSLPTAVPTSQPTMVKTLAPTSQPTSQPTVAKTLAATATQAPATPTSMPTIVHTPVPAQPTATQAANTATPLPASGTVIKSITFENGRLIDSANGVDRVTGSVALVNDSGMKGSYSASFPNSTNIYLQEDFTGVGDIQVNFLLYLNTVPTADVRIMIISNGGTTIGNLVMKSGGALRLRNGSTTIGADSSRLAAKTLYQVSLRQKRGSGGNAVLEAFVAPASGTFGAPFASNTTGSWTSLATFIRFGATASGALNARFDDIQLISR